MSDLFHESVPDEFITKVWDVMWACPQHTFQILTKRPDRMKKWVSENAYMMDFGWTEEERQPMVYGLETHIDTLFGRNRCGWANSETDENNGYGCDHPKQEDVKNGQGRCFSVSCPIAFETEDESEEMKLHSRPRYAFAQNVWLGTSVENQQVANERIPLLLETPAAVRFLSCEPLLGPVNLSMRTDCFEMVPGIDWIITGGESGPHARPMHPDWARSIRDQCQVAGVPFFFKQWGEYEPSECVEGSTAYHRVSDGEAAGYHSRMDTKRFHWWGGNWGDGKPLSLRVGKKETGRLLDGREWNEMPEMRKS